MTVHAQRLTVEAFAPFGAFYPMSGTSANPRARGLARSEGIGWKDCRTESPLIDLPGSLGVTRGGAAPYDATHMERHMNTQEALFCMQEPVILAVAPATSGDRPQARDIRVFVIQPGEVVMLERGVWHDACRGIGRDATYYWFAACNDDGPVTWMEIEGGPVHVEVALETSGVG
jgi:ureidoglycolate lyase